MRDAHTLAEKPGQRYGNARQVVTPVPRARFQGGSPAHDTDLIPLDPMAGRHSGMQGCQHDRVDVEALALGIVHLLARHVRIKRHVSWLVRRCWAECNSTRPESASSDYRPSTWTSAASVSGNQKVISMA
jgi:hypothetical protein